MIDGCHSSMDLSCPQDDFPAEAVKTTQKTRRALTSGIIWGSRPRKPNESFTGLLDELIYLDINLVSF